MTVRNIAEIDENDLVGECTRLPQDYFKYAEEIATAKQSSEAAAAQFSSVKAQLDLDIRACPEDYDIGKPTEAAVASAIIANGRYKIALKEVADAKYRVDLLQATLSTLEHKRRMLEALVSLHGQNYFSASVRPKTPEARAGLEEAKAEATSNKVAAAIRERRGRTTA